MVLIQHEPVKAHLFGIFVLVQIPLVELGSQFRVKVLVGIGQTNGRIFV